MCSKYDQRRLNSFVQLCFLCTLLSCVHHSHQEQLEGFQSPYQVLVDNSTTPSDQWLPKMIPNEHDHHHHHHSDLDACPEGQEKRRDAHGEAYCTEGVASPEIWFSALAAVVVISLCSVFGVLVVPVMQKVFYQHLIQFLVALAVGTLSGDAMMHLFPHAVLYGSGLSHDQSQTLERRMVWLGFFALVAFLVFYVLERFINMWGESKENSKKKHSEEKKKRVRVVRSGHRASSKTVGHNQCKNKYSSYCVSDVEDGPSLREPLREGGSGGHVGNGNKPEDDVVIIATKINNAHHEEALTEKSLTDMDTSYDTVFVREHEIQHHGHSHVHSHIHSKPDSISSVAWMVIMGDGIHNLADGIAIGTAFTQSTIFGIATAIAILCHELPHEIGDFAMLLKAGMTVKQAIFYNILSSILAFMGMVIGILLGSVEILSSWIFSATTGIFLYVALVDMVPELSSGHSHPYSEEPQPQADHFYLELVLQVLGMGLGVGVMLLIALYEHELKDAIS